MHRVPPLQGIPATDDEADPLPLEAGGPTRGFRTRAVVAVAAEGADGWGGDGC